MNVFTFHLAECGIANTLRALLRPPTSQSAAGLVHAECMVPMTLGRPVALPTRYQPQQLAMFAAWQSEDAIDEFLRSPGLGRVLAVGWHVRLEFVRRWGHVRELDGLPLVARELAEDQPVEPAADAILCSQSWNNLCAPALETRSQRSSYRRRYSQIRRWS